jgi:hypothetical protein
VGGLAELALEGSRQRTDASELRFSQLGQEDLAHAPIVGIRAPLREATRFELVDHRDHRARIDRRLLVELLLAHPGMSGDDRHHPEVAGMQALGLERETESAARSLAEAREQVAGVGAELTRYRSVLPHCAIHSTRRT